MAISEGASSSTVGNPVVCPDKETYGWFPFLPVSRNTSVGAPFTWSVARICVPCGVVRSPALGVARYSPRVSGSDSGFRIPSSWAAPSVLWPAKIYTTIAFD